MKDFKVADWDWKWEEVFNGRKGQGAAACEHEPFSII